MPIILEDLIIPYPLVKADAIYRPKFRHQISFDISTRLHDIFVFCTYLSQQIRTPIAKTRNRPDYLMFSGILLYGTLVN
jgi:hypothetical protein